MSNRALTLDDGIFYLPRGAAASSPPIEENTKFVVIDDNDIGRELTNVPGEGGPDSFDQDIPQVLAGASSVLIITGGPSRMTVQMMDAAAQRPGYFVVVDTAIGRIRIWAEQALASRGGAKGLMIIGPSSAVPAELQDRHVGDPTQYGIGPFGERGKTQLQ